ncbi:MaoC family dehydratase [Massilia sp. W12]|uniref:MaoC family dehydratase n=1 Tax=Massilia sp. W12 TaxID=3126507 RepID=UPI0030CE6C29
MNARAPMPARVLKRADLPALIGQELACSDWFLIDQARIQAFADVTLDQQWIHTDPERAAASPFGGTIAHGFLSLSLVPHFMQELIAFEGVAYGLNYGLNRVRFPSPLRAGSHVRAHITLGGVEQIEGGAQLSWQVLIEARDLSKPVCVAEMLTRVMWQAADS